MKNRPAHNITCGRDDIGAGGKSPRRSSADRLWPALVRDGESWAHPPWVLPAGALLGGRGGVRVRDFRRQQQNVRGAGVSGHDRLLFLGKQVIVG